jgi:hypothetical protein
MTDLSGYRQRLLDELRAAMNDIEKATAPLPETGMGDPFTDEEQDSLEAALERLRKAETALESWTSGIAVGSRSRRSQTTS